MIRVDVLDDDITRVRADGLITTVGSGGMWFGSIDRAIQRCAGNAFHTHLREERQLVDGQVVFASSQKPHGGQFENVLFVIDDLHGPLHRIVLAGLQEADRRKLAIVTLPTIYVRAGMLTSVIDRTAYAMLDEMATTVRTFVKSRPKHVKRINLIVHNGTSAQKQYLRRALELG